MKKIQLACTGCIELLLFMSHCNFNCKKKRFCCCCCWCCCSNKWMWPFLILLLIFQTAFSQIHVICNVFLDSFKSFFFWWFHEMCDLHACVACNIRLHTRIWDTKKFFCCSPPTSSSSSSWMMVCTCVMATIFWPMFHI